MLFDITIFLMLTDSLFGDTLDYNAKSLNPTFRPQKNLVQVLKWKLYGLF